MEGQITTAQLALLLTAVGIFVSVLSTLGMFLLQRLFGGGDTLRDQVHALALAQKDMEARIGGHVRDQYATKDDIRRLEGAISTFGESQKQYHESLLAVLQPLANQLIVSPVVR